MKLENAVRLGFSCGLTTVEECLNFVDTHYWYTIPQDAWQKERTELYEQEDLWREGKLKLDLESLMKEVLEDEKKFWDDIDNNKYNDEEIDFP